jgi:hypothetical protein
MKKKATKKTITSVQKELDLLRAVAGAAVKGYEKYLLDELNYDNLAKIMKNLRDHLPADTIDD